MPEDDEDAVKWFGEIGIAFDPRPLMAALAGAGVVALIMAIVNERRMQRHRQPGVTYWDVTLRRDGAWRRRELFTETGLVFQARAAKWGMIAAISLLVAFITWIAVNLQG